MVCFTETKTSASFIHRGECTGRHLVLIKMAFGCWSPSLGGTKERRCKCWITNASNKYSSSHQCLSDSDSFFSQIIGFHISPFEISRVKFCLFK